MSLHPAGFRNDMIDPYGFSPSKWVQTFVRYEIQTQKLSVQGFLCAPTFVVIRRLVEPIVPWLTDRQCHAERGPIGVSVNDD